MRIGASYQLTVASRQWSVTVPPSVFRVVPEILYFDLRLRVTSDKSRNTYLPLTAEFIWINLAI